MQTPFNYTFTSDDILEHAPHLTHTQVKQVATSVHAYFSEILPATISDAITNLGFDEEGKG